MNKRSISGYSGRDGKHVFQAKCDVRLDKNENEMLNELARRNGTSRSQIVRKAIRDFYKFNTEDGVRIE